MELDQIAWNRRDLVGGESKASSGVTDFYHMGHD